MEALNPFAAFSGLQQFLESGGPVLTVIMGVTFVMWALIVERLSFMSTSLPSLKRAGAEVWAARSDHTSWAAHKVREQMISEFQIKVNDNLTFIKTLVAVAPLLGLLGTVTGMIEVFDVLSFTGASNARAMAAGVSKATLPTMAGMVAALSGLFLINVLERRAEREVEKYSDDLVLM
jgi:biopolymer transport protein ExbB